MATHSKRKAHTEGEWERSNKDFHVMATEKTKDTATTARIQQIHGAGTVDVMQTVAWILHVN
jgi:hypothetical protein